LIFDFSDLIFQSSTMVINVHDLLVLSTIPGIGPNRLRALVSHFKDPHAIADASARELCAVEGIEKKLALTIANFFRDSGPALNKRSIDQQLSKLNKLNGRVVTFWDKEYPSNLKKIYDPPPYLFVRGEFADEDSYSIAVVGTRTPTSYGVQMAERFSSGLAGLGIPIVSGLARGIDTVAHTAALKSGGRTLAVIGCGVDVIYPPENKQLFERIIEHGAIVSEYLMGTKPDAGNFPRRNRIISGIALGTVIVETGVEGGAMITASTALDQNRATFAVPSGVSDKRRSGTNLLIKEGKAALLESVEDILTELQPQLKRLLPSQAKATAKETPELTLFEQQLYDVLSEEPLHIDLIAERTGLATSDALVHLLSMEFKGAVRQLRGKMFVKT
jgi:DNA processing protein